MSVRVMSAIWDLRDLSPVDKLALLALADWANDDGDAWPSIRQIADKTGCGERTVQRAFRNAEAMGILTRVEVKGKGCKYNIHPRHTGTGDTQAPPPHRRDTPATQAPNTSEHINVDKAKALPTKRARKKSEFALPDWVPSDAWARFEEMRLTIRKPMTDYARTLIIRELEKLRGPPGDILDQSTRNNWQDVYELKDKGNGQREHPNGMGRTERAALRAAQDLGLVDSRGQSRAMPAAASHATVRQEPYALLPGRNE